MNAKQITKDVLWAGKVDDRKVPFHRLILERGTTYNSYLILADKPTIIDTVDIAFSKEYIENLSKVTDLSKLHYVVINHVEPDHAGALPALLAKAPQAKIVSTKLASDILKDMFKLHHREFLTVTDGQTLDLGGKTLRFYETPYLHTEETMVTYASEDKILFPCDLFSTHIANDELFNDLAKGEYIEDFKIYYKLIMSPHRPYVRKMLDKIKNLDIEVIAPSHGYVLRKDADQFIGLYDQLSSLDPKEEKKVTIVYTTMTGNTAKIAQRIAKGLNDVGVETSIFNLKNAEVDQVVNRIREADGVLIGSATKYGDMVYNTEDLLKELSRDNANGKLASAFGSFGWSGEAIMHIEDYLEKGGFKVINQKYLIGATGTDSPSFPLRIRFASEEGLDLAEEAGRIFGEQVLTQ